MNPHIHKYCFDCTISNGHKHKITGYTENLLGFDILHFHYFYGTSSYNGHTHYFSGITGLPVRTANGHVHKMEGMLEYNNMHEHKYEAFTHEDVEYTYYKYYKKLIIN